MPGELEKEESLHSTEKQPDSQALLNSAPVIENIEVIALLGKGGMSHVYKARQTQLDRIVALKVLSKQTVQGTEAIARFQKEAKLTSTLEHPNIIKVISFGVSNDGQPYLVMEYLEGLSLAEELKLNGRLSLRKFQDIFIPVLSALNQAHQIGLVHRDIKPANIMICRGESGTSSVKLVDFGIAKSFDNEGSATANLTKSGSVVGTPMYMSPEQCQSKPLDGRSDIYSLACVMYESLTGEPPFTGDSLLEIMQKHSMQPPPTVSELSRKVDIRKELAQVTLWALAKAPDERPQSASEFSKQLNEVLESITLDKVPRLKQTDRANSNKKGMALISFCSFVLIAGGAVAFYIQHKGDKAALVSTSQDTPVSNKTADKNEESCLNKLARAEKRYGADSTQVAQSLLDLSRERLKQDKLAEAEQDARRALKIIESNLKPDDPLVITALYYLADCYRKEAKYKNEEPLRKQLLDLRSKSQNNPVQAMTELARCYIRQSKFSQAARLYEQAAELYEKESGPNTIALAETLTNWADCCRKEKENDKALLLYKRALTIKEQILGPKNKDIPAAMNAVANCYSIQENWSQAEQHCKKAISIGEQAHLPPNEMADLMESMADCYASQHKFADAAPFFQKAVALKERALGAKNQAIISSLVRLATCYQHLGKDALAESLWIRIISIDNKSHQTSGNDTVYYDALADCYGKQGKFSEAEPLWIKSLAIKEKTLGSDNPELGKYLFCLAACYENENKDAQAVPVFQKLLVLCDKSAKAKFLEKDWTLLHLSNCYVRMGKFTEAESFLKELINLRTGFGGPTHVDIAEAICGLGHCYLAERRPALAEPLYKQSYAILENRYKGKDVPELVPALKGLASSYEYQSKYADAEPLWKRTLRILKTAPEHYRDDIQNVQNKLMNCYEQQGKHSQAEQFKKSP